MNNWRNPLKTKPATDIRVNFLALGLFLFGLILVAQLARLQIFNGEKSRASAAKQHSTVRILPAERGQILYGERKSSDLFPLATNRVFQHLYVVPRDIQNASSTLEQLYPLLEPYNLPREVVAARLTKTNDIYEPLVHKLTDEEIQPILDLKLPGIEAEQETWRYYPENETLAHVIGFVDSSDERVGQYGLEGYYDQELRGQDGLVEGDIDIAGRLIQTGDFKRQEPESGTDFILTIDRIIQSYACSRLKIQAEKLGADGG
ncbi:MAG: hypothetical protein Q8L21_03500, partial [Candidatus Komeilibacteria bacterium]|nr:hypothetical protein [Candidatus Komeilibacteria bacterium]